MVGENYFWWGKHILKVLVVGGKWESTFFCLHLFLKSLNPFGLEFHFCQKDQSEINPNRFEYFKYISVVFTRSKRGYHHIPKGVHP